MTAALRLVPPPPPEPTESYPDLTERHADRQARMLIGALLYLPAREAQHVLDIVPDSAIADHTARWALELIRRVVHSGADVDPVTILGASRRHGPAGFASATPHQRHQLVKYLDAAAAAAPSAGDPLRAILAATRLLPLDTAPLRNHRNDVEVTPLVRRRS